MSEKEIRGWLEEGIICKDGSFIPFYPIFREIVEFLLGKIDRLRK